MERFAQAFAEAGFVVLVHDHRHFGASDGVERGDVDLGSRSPIGGVRFHFLRAGPKRCRSDRHLGHYRLSVDLTVPCFIFRFVPPLGVFLLHLNRGLPKAQSTI